LNLANKKILIGLSGSIAAYKIAFLVRLLTKENAEVKVVMTQDACNFITPLTLSTLSKNEVYTSFYNAENELWNNHVELALWADVFLIAPATGNTIAKLASGQSNNLLIACYTSAKCKVALAPAMDLDMWKHKSTQRNIETLKQDGVHIIDVESGELASGLVGKGRMAEPEKLVKSIRTLLKNTSQNLPLKNKHVLVSAGPTYEAIDPVRFIGNRSSGRMGIAIAERAAQLGAHVELVLGPSNLQCEEENVHVSRIESAEELFNQITKKAENSDIIVMAAAVADYTPITKASEKIKKKEGDFAIELKRTKDILKHLGKNKSDKQYLVGFALETNNELINAKRKLIGKNLNLIVLNSLKDKGAGFKHNTNKVSLIDSNENITNFNLKPKAEVAVDIFDKIIKDIAV